MHGWATNCESVLKDVHLAENNKALISNNNDSMVKIIMSVFDPLGFLTPFSNNNDSMVEIIMSIFDPLGFLTPFTIQSRILMQLIWSSKINWDEELQENETALWKRWLCDLEKVENCRIN